MCVWSNVHNTKLHHYLQHHLTELISKADPLKYILNHPPQMVSRKMCFFTLTVCYWICSQKFVKGQVLTDF